MIPTKQMGDLHNSQTTQNIVFNNIISIIHNFLICMDYLVGDCSFSFLKYYKPVRF